MALSSDQRSLVRQYLADPGTSAVQSIQIENATGGSFTLSFDGQTTAAIPYGSGANVVQNALCALSSVGLGNLTVNNTTTVAGVTSGYAVYFTGDLANAAQPMLTINIGSLTGSGVIADITQTVAGGVTAFSDDELDALYTDAGLNLFLTVAYGYRVLMANAAKFNDYTAGQTQEKKSQIFKNLSAMQELYLEWAFSGNQVQFTTLQSVPPRVTAVPMVQGLPATSLNYAPPYGSQAWWTWRRGRR